MCAFSSVAQETAKDLFNDYQSSLYQIRIINNDSNNKSSIGSGFAVSASGLIVTNYHVISDAVFNADNVRIEFEDHAGNQGSLKLRYIDVVNDLAVVQRLVDSPLPYLHVADNLPEQGSPIYSLGNPHDLGMIVVPGTFNGLSKRSFYQRIHFTGSINPGMSGGPVVNDAGLVMGVNVATAGNQIGFLVPLSPLQHLLANIPESEFSQEQFIALIENQLVDNQTDLVSAFIQQDWPITELGEAKIPADVVPFMSCWGDSNRDQENAHFLSVENRCRLNDNIFVHNSLRTGAIEMEFEWLQSDDFSTNRFYRFLSDGIDGAGAGNLATEEDVTNYRCNTHTVNNRYAVTTRSILCLRAYKAFDRLYDVLYVAASLDHQQAGLVSHFTLSGVGKSEAMSFTEKFIEAVSWQ